MGKLFIKSGGAWKQVQQIWVKTSGSWASVESGVIATNNVLGQFFPDTIAPISYSIPGTYTYTVPAGVTQIVTTIVGAGGGGGGSVFSGDGHGAANGGSGGYYQNQVLTVVPGETITIIVGAGGLGVSTGGGTQGGRGGTSSLSTSVSGLSYSATGGYGGNGVTGDNAPNNTSPANGSAGGSPNGVAGSYTASWMVNRNTSGQGYDGKGQNPTGYGSGGLGGNSAGGGALGGTGLVGGNGYVSLRVVGQVVFGDPTVNTADAARSGASYSWVVPTGVTSISINAAGGGGGAYAYHDGGYGQHAWAGGPGGGLSNLVLSVEQGDVISGVYGNGGGSSYYNGGRGGDGSATTIYKNGSLIATCGAGGNAYDARPPAVGTTTITAGYSGTATTGTAQTAYLDGSDGSYPSGDHYDPWSWVLGGSPSYPQSVLGTVAIQAPSALGTNYQRSGMPQVCGWVSITW